MAKYRAFYNRHQLSDTSDSPRPAQRVIKADSMQDAEDTFYKFRMAKNSEAGMSEPGRYKYIGMLHRIDEIGED